MKRKHILCIIGQLGNGGTEKQLYLFLKYLDKDKYIPQVVVSSSLYIPKWKQRFEDELKIQVTSLASYPAFAKFVALKFMLWRNKPDLIFSWSFYTNSFISVVGTIPFIGSLRGGIEEERSELGSAHFRSALKPKKFIVNSLKLFDELTKEGIGKEKIKTVLNIYERQQKDEKIQEAPESREKYDIPSNAVLVAGGGRNSAAKDFPLWLKAFEQSQEVNEEAYGILFGHGPKVIISKAITEKKLEEKIIITGDLPDVSALLNTSEIFFLSSLYEGLPNIVLEAIDAGCALLSTDTAGIRDILDGLDDEMLNLIILPDRNPETAAGKLNSLIKDQDLRCKIVNATQNTLDKFQPPKIMPEYYSVIDSMLGGEKSMIGLFES